MYEAGADGAARQKAPPTAVDLGNFASRDWMRAIVTDYSNHFAPLKNAGWFKNAKEGDEVLNPDESEMADWSGDAETLGSDANKPNVKAIVEFLVQQAAHHGTSVDPALAKKGRNVAVEGAWEGDLKGTSCADCHETIGEAGFVSIPESDDPSYPNLSGYGSAAWLKNFISNPGAAQHYAGKNQMPAYENRMTSQEMDLLVRWLVRDYLPTAVEPYADRRTGPAQAKPRLQE